MIDRVDTMEYDNYSTDGNHAALKDWANITGVPTSGLDQSFTTYYSTRGNSTGSTRYFLTNGSPTGSITGYVQYDIAGNAVTTIDARGSVTTFNFVDCFGAPDGEARTNSGPTELVAAGQKSYAFASSVTNALGHTAYSQLDYYLGMAVDTEDANGTTYSGSYNDVLDRPKQVIGAANRDVSLKTQTLFSYDDINRTTTQTSDFNSFNELNPLKVKMFYDGMGRNIETRRYESADNYIVSQQRYDALGRVNQVSNPFRNGETAVWTTTVYDELSRTLSVTTPDNAVATNSYLGNTATVTEQTGKKRKSVSDAMGRLTQVYEDPNGVNWLTNYTYDVLDNLTVVSQYDPVSQITQTRNFTYDSLKRLLSTTTPENGVVNYVYDPQGNVLVQTDARGVSKHYSYDALNRLTRSWYNTSSATTATINNNPALPAGVGASDEVNLVYDSQSLPAGAPAGFSRGYATGRLVAVTYGGGSSGDYASFDALGRPVLKIQQTGGINYQVMSTYNNGGAQKSLTYPSNRVVNYNYDLAGRLGDQDAQNLAFTGNIGDGVTRTYSRGIVYSPLGGMAKEQFGTDTPLYNKSFYNSRGQLSEIRVGTTYAGPTDSSWNRGAIINHYSNQCWGACNGTDNNGNVKRQEHWIPKHDQPQPTLFEVATQEYDYDNLNRLQRVHEGTMLQQEYVYDRYGNRTIHQTNSWGVGVNKKDFTVNTANNRLGVPGGQSGAMSYDAAGNLTNDTYTGQGQRLYDALNRITQAWANGQWQTYTYDGTGQRVKRNVNGAQTWQIFGMSGELLAEYASSGAPGSPQKEYAYRNGQLLITASGTTVNAAWTNTVGVAVSGNSLTKTAAEAWGNAGASSTQALVSGDGYVEFTASETNTNRMAGLSNGDSNQSYTDIDFAFYPANGALNVYEGGIHRGAFGTYAAGDRLRVAVEGGVVKYRKNGALLYTSGVNPTYPLLVDAALHSNGGTLINVVLSGNLSGGNGSGINWLVADQLGTPRITIDKTGSLANVKRHDYLPFGEELYAGVGVRTLALGYSGDNIRQQFTSYERDNETELDYAHARYYASKQGRFTGVDPISGSAGNPQSWNGYTYTLNDPVNLTDPTGMFVNAEFGYDPNRDSDPFLDYSRKRRLFTDDIERALAVYQEMVENGLANLKLKQQQKKEQAKSAPELTATVTSTPVNFVMNLPLDSANPENGPFFTGFASIQTITLLEDGKPVVGATGTESGKGSKGEKLIQNPGTFTTNADGQIFDLVSRGAGTAAKVDRETARKVFNENGTKPVDVTTQQTLTFKLPGGGSAQIVFERRLTNLDDNKKLRPSGPPKTGGPTNYTITAGPVTVRRLPRR